MLLGLKAIALFLSIHDRTAYTHTQTLLFTHQVKEIHHSDQRISACCDYWHVFLALQYCIRQYTHTHTNAHSVENKSALGSGQANAIWCPVFMLSNSQLHNWEAASPATVVGPPTARPPAPTLLNLSFLLSHRMQTKSNSSWLKARCF